VLHILKKLARIIPGLLIFSFGIFMNGYSEMGYSPWNVLSDGAAKATGTTFGTMTTAIGALIFIAVILLKEPLGVGSLLNMVLVGPFCDMYSALQTSLGFMPQLPTLPAKLIMCLISIPVTALGTCLYMSTQWGAGPRDSLNVAVTRKLPFPYAVCRASIEGAAFLLGWLLGGAVGVGSILNVALMAPTVGLIFRLFKIDIKRFKNENFLDTWYILRGNEETTRT